MAGIPGETISNKKLTGTELAVIVQNDVKRMLQRDGMLAGHVAYGRVAYRVDVTLYLEVSGMNEYHMSAQSHTNVKHPEIAAPPLPKSGNVRKHKKRVTRKIDNPNEERVRNGLPIPAQRRNKETGKMETVGISYTTNELNMEEREEPEVQDVEEENWG